jgi:hypothetical protein
MERTTKARAIAATRKYAADTMAGAGKAVKLVSLSVSCAGQLRSFQRGAAERRRAGNWSRV